MAEWPAALAAMVATLLQTRQPMLLFWGPELIQIYNDAFVPSFGEGKCMGHCPSRRSMRVQSRACFEALSLFSLAPS
jgi:hypothetical protein